MALFNLPIHGTPFGDDEPNGSTPLEAATTGMPTAGDAEAGDEAAEKIMQLS
jgi:hypothetical protein